MGTSHRLGAESMPGEEDLRKSVVSSLKLLLTLQCAGLLLTLTAGVSLLAHVGQFSECLLFSYKDGESLSYGEDYYCEAVGYGLVVTGLLMMVIMFLTIRQITSISTAASLYVLRKLRYLDIKGRTVLLHLLVSVVVIFFSAATLAGYFSSCGTFHQYVTNILHQKQSLDPREVRGESVEERFVDDVVFWRYARQVTNSFGAKLYILETGCRALFTDPDLATVLHDNHWEKYSGYYGYWYRQDIYNTDSTTKAITNNALIEATITTSCLSALVWLSLTVFLIVIKRRTERRTKSESLHLLPTFSPRGLSLLGQADLSNTYSHNTERSPSMSSRRDIDSVVLANILDPVSVLWTGGRRSHRLNNLNTSRRVQMHQLKPLLKTSLQAHQTEIL